MTDSRLPHETSIAFDENNIPVSLEFDDPFYSKSDGFLETETVFLKACNIPQTFSEHDGYVIAETGFGTGLNFLITMKTWGECADKHGVLHFITFEKYILPSEVSHQAHQNWPEIEEYSQQLLSHYPKSVNGVQRIWFSKYNVALTIVVGDINETIEKMDFQADAWFLDGFAPSKNPDMWSENLFQNIRRLSKDNVKIGTYTVARLIRDNLEKAGFTFAKREGFGKKRERLEAWIEPTQEQAITNPKSNLKVAIIGGGIAGCATAAALAKRNCNVTIFDNDTDNLTKASGNIAGLIMPRVDRLPTLISQFFINAFIYAGAYYRNLSLNAFEPVEIYEKPKSERDFEKLAMFRENPPLPSDVIGFGDDYFIHKFGGKIVPQNILKELGQSANHIDDEIAAYKQIANGKYAVKGLKQTYAEFDKIVICGGQNIERIAAKDFYLGGKAGVVSISTVTNNIPHPLAGKGYCLSHDGKTVFGATFDAISLEDTPKVSDDCHQRNHEILEEVCPNISAKIPHDNLDGRASVRVVSKDKLPIAGEVGQGIWVLGALGSRGFSTSPILAEAIACKICDEPLPIFTDLLELTSPKRFDIEEEAAD